MPSESEPSVSNAIVRKREADLQVMAPPPPPAKKMKRPKQVLDEESYTEGLSQIIKRDFFPGLQEVQLQSEYLDALASRDKSWISSATQNLLEAKTPGLRSSMTPMRGSVKQETPSTVRGFDTPASVAPSIGPSESARVNTAMRLSQYQATYTSEDNESFYRLTDRQNQKRVEKNAWLWNKNKYDSKQLIAQRQVENKLLEAGTLTDDGFMKKDRLAIKDSDDRPAQPDLWKWKPKNELMFTPDGIEDRYETRAEKAEAASSSAPKGINYHNTQCPTEAPPNRDRQGSPTLSTVRAALAGNVPSAYRNESERGSTVTGSETPRVNGYAFVDDEDDDDEARPLPVIDLGPGDARLNPFKIQDRGKKEDLLHRMVDRINKSHAESSRHGFTGKAQHTPSSKLIDSPRTAAGSLTPAAQRLLGKLRATTTPKPGSSSFSRDSFAPSTPMVSRGSLIKKTPRKK
ncbi:hypothetical protein TD95_002203 [Thielaviopsis punctulata]|uniref:Nuclear protein Es2 n=1 Tax=Thielaviopsis punctulata TaxID=72032 RepID=A0A0F4ZEL1_9PEZI|nr:hypothetical protein TD95_002203 [Thielaviopsis punctulata]